MASAEAEDEAVEDDDDDIDEVDEEVEEDPPRWWCVCIIDEFVGVCADEGGTEDELPPADAPGPTDADAATDDAPVAPSALCRRNNEAFVSRGILRHKTENHVGTQKKKDRKGREGGEKSALNSRFTPVRWQESNSRASFSFAAVSDHEGRGIMHVTHATFFTTRIVSSGKSMIKHSYCMVHV